MAKTLMFTVFLSLLVSVNLNAQNILAPSQKQHNPFWENVSFGGGLGLNFGNGFFYGSISPSAIYNFNQYFSAGLGLSYAYLDDKRNDYRLSAYGGSIIALFNPIREIQLSAELEGLQVDQTFLFSEGNIKDNYFQEALFLGLGFRTGNVTIGARYNVLYNKNRNIYGSALMPFVRVYF
jgi:hypothetical protein